MLATIFFWQSTLSTLAPRFRERLQFFCSLFAEQKLTQGSRGVWPSLDLAPAADDGGSSGGGKACTVAVEAAEAAVAGARRGSASGGNGGEGASAGFAAALAALPLPLPVPVPLSLPVPVPRHWAGDATGDTRNLSLLWPASGPSATSSDTAPCAPLPTPTPRLLRLRLLRLRLRRLRLRRLLLSSSSRGKRDRSGLAAAARWLVACPAPVSLGPLVSCSGACRPSLKLSKLPRKLPPNMPVKLPCVVYLQNERDSEKKRNKGNG
jgi:hypothetical protein